MALAPSSLQMEFVEIGDLPLYTQDLDENSPEAYEKFRAQVREAEAFLFVTPEHNRSFPAAMKNALDVGSRPWGQNAWNGKPAAIVSASPGAIGGFGATHHLRQVLAFLNLSVMAQPEAYLGGAYALFDESGELTNEDTRKFLDKFASAFAAWIERVG